MGLFDIFKKENSSRIDKLKNNFSNEKEKQRIKKEIANTKKLDKYKILKERLEAIVLDEDFNYDLKEFKDPDLIVLNKNHDIFDNAKIDLKKYCTIYNQEFIRAYLKKKNC